MKYIEFIPIKAYQNNLLGWGTSMICYFLSVVDYITLLISFGFIKSNFYFKYMLYAIHAAYTKRSS